MKKRSLFTTVSLAVCGFFISAAAIAQTDSWGPKADLFPHGNGITRAEYPIGLDFPSFNNYVDSGNGLGITDERAFLVAKNYTKNPDGEYADTVEVETGDVVLLSGFINNNGQLGDDDATALDVKTRIDGFVNANGEFYSPTDIAFNLKQLVSSTNADPEEIWDTVNITAKDETPVVLKYREGLSITPNVGGDATELEPADFFGDGVLIGDPSNPTGGEFKPHVDNAMHVFAYFDVIDPSEVPNDGTLFPNTGCSGSNCVTTFNVDKHVSKKKGSDYKSEVILESGNYAHFRVKVKNTGKKTGNVKLEDNLGVPTNGGSLGNIEDFHISCHSDANCSGTLKNDGTVSINNLKSYKTVTITYKRKVSKNGIPFGGFSEITDTAKLKNGSNDSDRAKVMIVDVIREAVCPDAHIKIPVDLAVLCRDGRRVDSEKINIPAAGNYDLFGYAERGRLSDPAQCQRNENFTLSINGKTGPIAVDDEQECAISFKNQYMGNFDFDRGENTVTMTSANNCPDGQAGSVHVRYLCMNLPQDPEFKVYKKVSLDGQNFAPQVTAENGDTVSYKIFVENVGQGVGDVVLSDALQAGSTGGSMGSIESFSMQCAHEAVCSGSLQNGDVTISNLRPNMSVTINYTRTANGDDVEAGTTTEIPDTASLNTSPPQNSTAKVLIEAPALPPVCEISANPAAIKVGESTTLTYTTEDAESGEIDNGGGSIIIPNGTKSLSPTQTTTYELTVWGPGGSATCETTVDVTGEPDFTIEKQVSTDGVSYQQKISQKDGQTAYYKVVVTNTGTAEGTVDVTDTLLTATNGGSLGNVTAYNADCTNASCSGSLAGGAMTITDLLPNKSVTLTYQRSVSANGIPAGQSSEIRDNVKLSGDGIGNSEASVVISSPAAPFCSLTADPTQLIIGESATLNWTTSNVTSATIDQQIGDATVPSGSESVSPTETTKYTMTAYGDGGSTTCETTINVNGKPEFKLDKRIYTGSSWGDNAQVPNGRTAYYRIAVQNTGTGAGNFTLTDSLSAPSNGGSLSAIGTEDLDCPQTADCSGTLNAGGVSVTNLEPGQIFTIDYQRTVSNAAVPAGEISTIRDTAVLSTGQTDVANVSIPGPGLTPNFMVNKTVAMTEDGAYGESITVNNGGSAYYKIVVTNGGNGTGTVTVTDELGAPSNNGSLGGVENLNIMCDGEANCTGNLTNGGVVINNLKPNTTVTITYSRTANTGNIPNGENSVITDTAKLSNGSTDTANVTLRAEGVTPQFTINKKVAASDGVFKENVILKEGEIAYYRIVVENIGSGSGTVNVTDALAAPTNGGSLSALSGEVIDCPVNTACVGSLAAGGIQIDNLGVGKQVVIDYQRTASNGGVPAGSSSNIIDTATLIENGVGIASNEATVTVEGIGTSRFLIEKEVSADGLAFGETIGINHGSTAFYKITVTNRGQGPGTTTLTDAITSISNGGSLGPIVNENIACPNATCIGSVTAGSLEINNLKSGGSVIVTYGRVADKTGIPPGANSILVNTARLNTGENDKASVIINGSPSAPTCSNFISIPQSVNPGNPFSLNWNSTNQASFIIQSNNGHFFQENGSTTRYEVGGGINAETIFTVTLYNEPEYKGLSTQCRVTVPVNSSNFDISKLVSTNAVDFSVDPITIEDGESAYYAVVVKNTGSFAGSVEILDQLDPGTRGGSLTLNGPAAISPPGICPGGNVFDAANPLICVLQPNATVTITYSRTAQNDTIEVGEQSSFENTATIVTTGSSAKTTVHVPGPPVAPDLAVQITADDLSVPPTTADATTTINYTVNWQNLGNVDMANATIDVACTEEAVTNLQSGSGSVTDNTIVFGPFNTTVGGNGSYQFSADLIQGFGLNNPDDVICTAHIESADFLPIDEKETNADNNDDSVMVNVDIANGDARFKKVKNTRTGVEGVYAAALPGDTLIYTLGYRAGDQDANGFVFSDDISDILEYAEITDNGGGSVSGGTISWPAVNISAFNTETVSFTVKVFDDIETINGDFVMWNVYGKDEVVVELPIIDRDKKVSVNNGPLLNNATAKAGDILTYTLYVTNTGAVHYEGFVVTDDISSVLVYADMLDNGGGTVSGGTITWDPITIPAGETVAKTFQVQIQNPLPENCTFRINNIYGEEVVVEITETSLSKSVTNNVTGSSGVSVEAEGGHDLTYTLTVTENGGEGNFENFVFADNIADILEYAELGSISNGGDFDPANQTITWPATTIPAGGTVTRTFNITVNPENQWPSGGDFVLNNFFGNLVTVTVGEVIVDTVIVKTASVAEAAPTLQYMYTLAYRNDGERAATSSFIIDDFDESKLRLIEDAAGNPILPVNCEYTDLADPAYTLGGPMGIRCALGTIPAESDTSTLSFGVVVLDDTETDIVNTAIIGQNEKDENPANNRSTVTTPIVGDGLVLTKTVTPTSLSNGQIADYTVNVTNTAPINKTFTLTDELAPGNNGGELNFINTSLKVEFTPADSGKTAGTFQGGGNITITDLEPGASVRVTYQRQGFNAGIDFNQTSQFVDTATIVETGMTDTAEVFVVGPTRGGGGGGGGGGGSRRVTDNINLLIQKYVKGMDDKWHDADTYDLAEAIPNRTIQDIRYRIEVTNEGNVKGQNIEVEDIFTSNTLRRLRISDVIGATYDSRAQVFTIDSLRSGETETIEYEAKIEKVGKAHEMADAKNIATIIAAEAAPVKSVLVRPTRTIVRGIGNEDPAHVKTEMVDEKITLQKTVNKRIAKPDEEVQFNIIVHNRGDIEYQNLEITDNFPFQFVDLIQANDLRNIDKANETLTFTKRSLKPGDIWIVKLHVKTKNTVTQNTLVRNSVTITAENSDLSKLYAYAEFVVQSLPKPPDLVPSGPLAYTIATILLGMMMVLTGRRFTRKR
jgi:uncharacterized repeat protein (TIGR01451 family)